MAGPERFEELYQHAFLEMIQQLRQIPREVWVEGTESFNILKPVFTFFCISSIHYKFCCSLTMYCKM
ncbi:DUF6930 domain-containing protein [Tepidibacillus marianensis]|uniref:DUF6930 domain-containing protein n=1 Tax=Tepidibacillus marianensis TaxID=3131995 RepID=UPI00386FC81B